jgi:uracil-DNA glycosylase
VRWFTRPMGAPWFTRPVGAPWFTRPVGAPWFTRPMGAPWFTRPVGAPWFTRPMGEPVDARLRSDSMPITEPGPAATASPDLGTLERRIADCFACPRLVAWREAQARVKVARFRDETYWARPVPGYGDPGARIMLVGLAPAAHGGNRTGRVFTGDASGDFLWRSLHAVGLADRPSSRRADDGLTLHGVRVAAAVRCAPPANKPTPAEEATCRPWLVREIALLPELRVLVPLGSIGWIAALRALAALGHPTPRPRPAFGHGAEAVIGPYVLVGSYHPSQQNTFTGTLTAPMLEAVLERAKALAAAEG